ncbi:MAG: mycothiol synthase [Actinomycetota bacterium]|nr:mycothiol synthase [Actinomycetota bacterium]
MGQWRTEVVHGPLSRQARVAVAELVAAATAGDGTEPLSDAALLASPPTAEHVLVWSAAGGLVGYAHVDSASQLAEFVVAPTERGRGLGTYVADQVAELGAVGAWAHADLPAARAIAHARGLVAQRRLLFMTRSTADLTSAEPPPGLLLRPYPGPAADATVLAVNAAAFVDLPDQGGWTGADLTARTAAPWFRREDLLLLVDPHGAGGARLDEGRLAGFHWTKVHPDGTGEVYVVGLDPAYQGKGLGAPLTMAGLVHLAARGCTQVGLFVDSSNGPALALYRRLDFRTARQDVLYRHPDG